MSLGIFQPHDNNKDNHFPSCDITKRNFYSHETIHLTHLHMHFKEVMHNYLILFDDLRFLNYCMSFDRKKSIIEYALGIK